MLRYVQMTDPGLLGDRYPGLASLSQRCEAMPEFRATFPPDVVYPRND